MNGAFTEVLGIVGATGAVGREMLAILEAQHFPAAQLRLFASDRSAGTLLPYADETMPVQRLTRETAAEADAFLFAANADTARAWIPPLVEGGLHVVDNSSAFRDDPSVPLVIPEINGSLLQSGPRLVANPNCSTILLLAALDTIRRSHGIESIRVATYQAVSGAGSAGMVDLRESAVASLHGQLRPPGVFPEPTAFNVFCHESALDEGSGWCGEELKIVREARKIWDAPDLDIVPICVRVPVFRAHSQAVWVRLREPASRSRIRELLRETPGVRLVDDPRAGRYPTPLAATGLDDVLVGRIRPGAYAAHSNSADFDDNRALSDWSMFLSGDQLRKGAALNALQILQRIWQVAGRRPKAVGRS